MQIFYSSSIVDLNQSVEIDGQEHIHLSKVLRRQINEDVFVANGQGSLFRATIISIAKKKTVVLSKELIAKKTIQSNLHLAVGLTKNNSRYEWLVEKTTEFGVNSISPFFSNNSERKTTRIDRLQAIALSAMKQSKQLFLPAIEDSKSLKQFLEMQKEFFFDKRIICYCNEESTNIKEHLNCDEKTLVLIGSEGGFLESEVALSKEYGFVPVTLGTQRLRTETAAIAVAALFNM